MPPTAAVRTLPWSTMSATEARISDATFLDKWALVVRVLMTYTNTESKNARGMSANATRADEEADGRKGAGTDLLNGDRLLSRSPGVVVGRGADERVRDLGLSSELGLGDGGHW